MSWDRKLWGVLFTSKDSSPTLIGNAWSDPFNSRYEGEPSRVLLFTTRRSAQEWCKEKRAQYKDRPDSCRYWKFRPVRVRETVKVSR